MADKAEVKGKDKQPSRKPDIEVAEPEAGTPVKYTIGEDLNSPDSHTQARRLRDSRLPAAQRRALAQVIMRKQGNRYLSKLLTGNLSAYKPGQPNPSFRLRSVSPGTVQRQILSGITGRQIGTISFRSAGRSSAGGPVTVQSELIPPDTPPNRFDGFEQRILAYQLAWRDGNLCAVVEDDDGRFHTLKSGWPGREGGIEATVQPVSHGFRNIWFTNVARSDQLQTSRGVQSWRARVQSYEVLLSAWRNGPPPDNFAELCPHEPSHAGDNASAQDMRRCLERQAVQLLAEALQIPGEDIHIVPDGGAPSPDALVNLDMNMAEAHGRGGIGHLPIERGQEAELPTVTFGPDAFNDQSYLHTMATAIHEAEHVRHVVSATELKRRWERSRPRRTFPTWMRQQLERLERQLQRGQISQEEYDARRQQYDLARELVRGGLPRTESLARLEAFVNTYHRMHITPGGGAYERLESLRMLATYWPDAGEPLQRSTMRRLRAYVQSLDEDHRQELETTSRRFLGQTGGDVHRFWQTFIDQVLV